MVRYCYTSFNLSNTTIAVAIAVASVCCEAPNTDLIFMPQCTPLGFCFHCHLHQCAHTSTHVLQGQSAVLIAPRSIAQRAKQPDLEQRRHLATF